MEHELRALHPVEAIATAIYDNLLAPAYAAPKASGDLPSPSRLPPPRAAVGTPGVTPERQLGSSPLKGLPTLSPPKPGSPSRPRSAKSWQQVRQAYDRGLNPHGWPEPTAVKEAAEMAQRSQRLQSAINTLVTPAHAVHAAQQPTPD